MKKTGNLSPTAVATYFLLFLALTAFCLNLVERAENHLLGVDGPARSVGVRRTGSREYCVYLLGTARTVNLDDELESARERLDALVHEARARLAELGSRRTRK